MSYNNIGLSTPRGSGTSGHIQANRSHLRQRPREHDKPADFADSFAHRAPDQSILDHERKRRIEAQCFELQVQLEDDGVAQDDIDAQVSALRERLTAQQAAGQGQRQTGSIKSHERHELAAAKAHADERMRKALGIKADHVEGLAFNREYQEQQKQQRQAERERGREERARIEAELKADRERAMRERDAQRKRHEDDLARERRSQQDELERGRREHAQRMRDLDAAPAEGGKGRLPYDGAESGAAVKGTRRSRSPPPRLSRRYGDSRSRSPERRRSASPPPRRRGRSPTRSPSRSRSRSPAYRRRSYSPSRSRSCSRSPPRRRARRDSPSRSRSRSRSRSPPPRKGRSPSPRGRSRSRSMSMSRSPSPER
ncbi:hypothetical protein JCM10207_001104 [Rhodosporidiobolus poonsookiae]